MQKLMKIMTCLTITVVVANIYLVVVYLVAGFPTKMMWSMFIAGVNCLALWTNPHYKSEVLIIWNNIKQKYGSGR